MTMEVTKIKTMVTNYNFALLLDSIFSNCMAEIAFLLRILSMNFLFMRNTISLSIISSFKCSRWVSTRRLAVLIILSGKLSEVNAPIWRGEFQHISGRNPNFRSFPLSLIIWSWRAFTLMLHKCLCISIFSLSTKFNSFLACDFFPFNLVLDPVFYYYFVFLIGIFYTR